MKQVTVSLSDRQIRRLTSNKKSRLSRSFLKRFAGFERTIKNSNYLSSVDVFDFFIKNQKTILKQLNAIAKRNNTSAAAMLSQASLDILPPLSQSSSGGF